MAPRTLIGLNIAGGGEGVDACVVDVQGIGFSQRPRVRQTVRVPLLPDVRGSLTHAIRKLSVDPRSVFAIGVMNPSNAAEVVADATGVTVVTSFAARDIAAGGRGHPITAAADYLFLKGETDHTLIHLGGVATLTHIPANAKTTSVMSFDAGPGNRWLDALVRLGTRNETRETGVRAVQGRCCEELLSAWERMPFMHRKPPKVVRDEFNDDFAARCIDDAKRLHVGLNDLLCTATHFVARCLRHSFSYLPSHTPEYYFSGGGSRNGFLKQLLPGVRRSEEIGIPVLGHGATAAAVLAALMLDGASANMPHLTGAAGPRVLGRIVPGDARHWAATASWAAGQLADYPALRAA